MDSGEPATSVAGSLFPGLRASPEFEGITRRLTSPVRPAAPAIVRDPFGRLVAVPHPQRPRLIARS